MKLKSSAYIYRTKYNYVNRNEVVRYFIAVFFYLNNLYNFWVIKWHLYYIRYP